jgi:quinol monooxygenase YgiN
MLALRSQEVAMIDLVVTQRVKPGMEQAFEALARQFQANTLALDEGCLRYEWYKSAEPHTYILIERWTELAAAQAHLKADHMTALWPRFEECTPEKFSIMRLIRLD